jgi:hypothetical protein
MALAIDHQLATEVSSGSLKTVAKKRREKTAKPEYGLSSSLGLVKSMLDKTSKIGSTISLTNQQGKQARKLTQLGIQTYDRAIAEGKDPGNSLSEALLAMLRAMGAQRNDFVNYENEISKLANKLQDAMLKGVKEQEKERDRKIEKERHKEHEMKIFKWVGVAVMSVVSVLMIASGNYAAGAMLLALTVATATGGMKKATDKLGTAIGDSLGGSARDELIGKILAAVTVTVITTILGAGAGAVDGAISASGEAADVASSEGSEVAESTGMSKTAKGAVKSGVTFGLNETAQSGLAQNLTGLILMDKDSKMSEKDKKIIEAIVEGVVSLLAMVGSGYAMSSMAEDFASTGSKTIEAIKKMADMSDSQLMNLQRGTQVGLTMVQVGQGVGQGTIEIQLGDLMKDIGRIRGDIDINQMKLSQVQEEEQSETENTNKTLKQMGQTQQNVNQGINTTFGTPSEYALRG